MEADTVHALEVLKGWIAHDRGEAFDPKETKEWKRGWFIGESGKTPRKGPTLTMQFAQIGRFCPGRSTSRT